MSQSFFIAHLFVSRNILIAEYRIMNSVYELYRCTGLRILFFCGRREMQSLTDFLDCRFCVSQLWIIIEDLIQLA